MSKGSINKVILIGNLGSDPELRFTPRGVQVANFNLATSESWTDKCGERQERAEWHRIVLWRRPISKKGQQDLHRRQVANPLLGRPKWPEALYDRSCRQFYGDARRRPGRCRRCRHVLQQFSRRRSGGCPSGCGCAWRRRIALLASFQSGRPPSLTSR